MPAFDLLYADPDPDRRARAARAIEGAGVSVRAVDPGGLAAALSESRPSAVLVDLDTPSPDPTVRRIVYCSPDRLSNAVRAVRAGARDILLLPLDPDAVARAVDALSEPPAGPSLHHSDDQVRVILEASPIPQLVSRASDGTILYINEHLSALLGMRAAELLGQVTPDFYYDRSDRAVVLAALERDGHLFNHELRIKNKDGDLLWVLSSMVATRLNDEAVIIVGIYDITERKQIEEALRESEEIFRQLTDAIDDLFWMYDLERNERVFASAGFAEKYREDFGPDATYLDMAHPDDRDRLQREMDAAWGKPVKVETQFRIVMKDGSVRWIRSRGFPILNEAGEVYRYCGLDVDVTDRVEQEEALRESEELFRQLTDNIDDVFWIYDTVEERVVFLSKVFVERYGEPPLGPERSYLDIVHPDDRERAGAVISAENEPDDHRTDDVWRVIQKDGAVRWVRSRSFPVFDAEGSVYRYCGLESDITEQVEQEEALRESEANLRRALEEMERTNRQLRETQAKLVQSEKMASLGNLVAGVAHEINTPIGAIHSMHDSLARGTTKLREALESDAPDLLASNRTIQRSLKVLDEANRVVKTGTDRVTTIVRSLRSFARLDEAEKKEARLSDCIDDALTLVQHEVKGRVTVEKTYADLPPIVCFPSRLNQVFLNILVNASQAIRDSGTIRIRTSAPDADHVRVEVADDGPGIPPEAIGKVFDPGFTMKGVGVGTGLGLSICYQIVQDHGGEIRVDSAPGEGATFTIDLPRQSGDGT